MNDLRPLITKKRDGLTHTREELATIADAAATKSVPDYQLSAWLMAAYLNPLSLDETAWLTQSMARSGEILNLSRLPAPHLDKHSTGGVGDKTTLVLLPLLASAGLTMLKMSGEGLGKTGGTIDKLRSIPGFRVELTSDEMLLQAASIGLALTGQTHRLAPADKTLYALRDATATTASIPLIASSILSKKLAGGAQFVLIDVKCGSGAFMSSQQDARRLADALVQVGTRCGLQVRTHLTDMSQPLGACVGNAIEVSEALDVLEGRPLGAASSRFRTLCVEFAADALLFCGMERDGHTARHRIDNLLDSGAALAKAEQWVSWQGGPPKIAELRRQLPSAAISVDITAVQDGWIEQIHAGIVGEVAVDLGGGRRLKGDSVDPGVGLRIHAEVGEPITRNQPIVTIYAQDEAAAMNAQKRLKDAVSISGIPVEAVPIFL